MTPFARATLWITLAMISASFASVGLAQDRTVPVRTGEHAGFTRIVIDFQRRPGWRLGTNAGRYELWLDDRTTRFGLDDAFRRLQGQRIADIIDLGQGRLAIDLTCTCSLSVDQLPNQGLLIDIRDEPPGPDNRWAASLVDEGQTAPIDEANSPAAILPVVLPQMREGPRIGPLAETPANLLTPIAAQRVRDLQMGLIEQTARAASQGLISLPTDALDSARKGQMTATNMPAQEPVKTVLPPPMAPNIRIETQFDRDSRAVKDAQVREQTFECLAPNSVDVGAWFGDHEALESLGRARMNLVDVRDRPDPRAHAILARMLIHLTFGREARDVVAQGPASVPNRDLLLELAAVVDGDLPTELSILPTQTNCDSSAAVWGLLAHRGPLSATLVNTPAVVRAVSAFPNHLRQYLGPRIAEKLVDIGENEAARLVLNAIQRGVEDRGPEASMVQARLDQIGGNTAAADENYASVAASRSDQAALALSRLIINQIDAGQAVSDDLIAQAMALAFEFEATPETEVLPQAIVAALSHQEKFEKALTQIDRFAERGRLDAETVRTLKAQTLEHLAQSADDAAFLRVAVPVALAGSIDDPVRLALARRLVALGMAAPARAALGTRADIPQEEERYILAEIAILEGKRSVATSYLTGLTSDKAVALRARAEALSDRPTAGLTAASDAPEPAPTEGEAISPGALAQNRELLSETRAMRESVLSLLEERSN